jgi:transmembrane sensor
VSITTDSDEKRPLPDSVRGEAAVWLARLHSDLRTEKTESGFRAWLASSAEHRAAFEQMTGIWESTANLRRDPPPEVTRSCEFGRVFRRVLISSAATFAVCALIAVAALYVLRMKADYRSELFITAVGQRRLITLADGSRVELNTDSRLRVTFTSRARRVILEKGQARFEVVRNAECPFVVRVAESQIVALGTSFDVRWTDEHLSIVLVEGHVAVLPADESLVQAATPSAVTLVPGEQLEFLGPAFAVKSAVRLDREEAWVSGRVVFDATRLGAALAEMNRYAHRRLELATPGLADLRISGTFSVDDPGAFARAVAQMFSLTITEAPEVVLLGPTSE